VLLCKLTILKLVLADLCWLRLCQCLLVRVQFVKDVLHVVDCQDALKPQELRTSDRVPHEDHQVWCEKTWSHVLPTLEYWALELRQLKVT